MGGQEKIQKKKKKKKKERERKCIAECLPLPPWSMGNHTSMAQQQTH
jgi:hypothetical protein